MTPTSLLRLAARPIRRLTATEHGPFVALGAATLSLLIGGSTIAMGGVAGADGADPQLTLTRVADVTATVAVAEARFEAAQQARLADEAARLARVASAAASRAAAEERARIVQGVDGSQISVWPARGAITGRWAERRPGHYHAGIDIDGNTGDPIYAAGPGVIAGVGRLRSYGGYGNVVLIEHANGYSTLSAHLSRIDVSVGQKVAAGQVVGAMGCTGRCSGSHLHFEVRKGDRQVNPNLYLP